jgi:hypothetical protein
MLPDPTDVPPVDPDELATAFNLVVNTAAGRVALERSIDELRAAAEPDKRWLINDKPLTRGLAALRERYADPQKFNDLALRIAAITFALLRPGLERWVRPAAGLNEGPLLHPAVLDAAASTPLNPNYEFDTAPFLALVEQIAAERYSGWV